MGSGIYYHGYKRLYPRMHVFNKHSDQRGGGGKETDATKPARSRHIATHDHVRDAQHKLTTQTAFANLIRPHNENLV